MSSLIEQAAMRLAQLRQAGVEMPDDVPRRAPAEPTEDEIFATLAAAAAVRASRAEEPPHPAAKRVELDLVALAAAFAAFGGGPPLAAFVFAYVIGQLGGLIPLPGGIGGTDGGLIAALTVYGSPLSQATAAVLAYRAFQLGVPVLLGSIAFVQLRGTLARSEAPAALCEPITDPLPVFRLPGFET